MLRVKGLGIHTSIQNINTFVHLIQRDTEILTLRLSLWDDTKSVTHPLRQAAARNGGVVMEQLRVCIALMALPSN